MVNEIFWLIELIGFFYVLDKFQALIQLKDPNSAAQAKIVSSNFVSSINNYREYFLSNYMVRIFTMVVVQ